MMTNDRGVLKGSVCPIRFERGSRRAAMIFNFSVLVVRAGFEAEELTSMPTLRFQSRWPLFL